MANSSLPLVCIAVSIPLLRNGLAALFKENLSSVRCQTIEGVSDLSRQIQELQPDLLIVDTARLTTLVQSNPSSSLNSPSAILLIAPPTSLPSVIQAAQRMTIQAWLPLDSDPGRIVRAAQYLLEGRTDFNALPELLDTFLRERTPPPALSERERQVLTMIAMGYTNDQISESLALQPGTVKNHVTTIYHKIGVHSRAEAVSFMWKNPDLFCFDSPAEGDLIQ
ncbi:MAG: response regulator transcription factor [Chloroflexota bacterium]